MVLEEGATAHQSFEDNVPFSDTDPYASGKWGSQSPFSRYPFTAFPTQVNIPPMNLVGRMLLSEKNYSERVAMPLALRLSSMSAVLKRFPNQEETDAVTEQVASKVYTSRLGTTLGFLIGISRIRVPKELHPPKNTPAETYWRVLVDNIRLNPSPVTWSTGRGVFVVCLWTLGAGFIADFYGSATQAYATMSDPRLAEYRTKVQSQNPVELRKQITDSNKETVDRWRKETVQRYRQSQGMVTSDQDDASPTGGMMNDYNSQSGKYAEAHDTGAHGSGSGSYSGSQGSTSYSQARQTGPQQQQQRQPQYQYPGSQSTATSDTRSGTDFFDDASPTAPDHDNSRNASYTGSAWARIRHGSSQPSSDSQGSFGSSPNQQSQQQQYEGQYSSSPTSSMGSSGSSYGSRTHSDFQYSDSDRERQMAREQAQKEFDRMVDSERQGSDVSADSSNGHSFGRGGAWARR